VSNSHHASVLLSSDSLPVSACVSSFPFDSLDTFGVRVSVIFTEYLCLGVFFPLVFPSPRILSNKLPTINTVMEEKTRSLVSPLHQPIASAYAYRLPPAELPGEGSPLKPQRE